MDYLDIIARLMAITAAVPTTAAAIREIMHLFEKHPHPLVSDVAKAACKHLGGDNPHA